MAKSVIAICDAGLAVSERRHLPEKLSLGLKDISGRVKAFVLTRKSLDPSAWVWNWDADADGDFENWLAGDLVGLSWPDASGIAVQCGIIASCIWTGVRFDVFESDTNTKEIVLHTVRAVAKTLGAHRVVLIPDSGDPPAEKAGDLFHEGFGFDEIADQAHRSALAHFYTVS